MHAAEELDQGDAGSIAQSLQSDFIRLIAIFDRQLANKSAAGGKASSKIADARAAAQRGVRLSEELVEMLSATR